MRMPSSFLVSAGLIIPERVKVVRVADSAKSVGQPEIDERPKALPGGPQEQGVVDPSFGPPCVDRHGNDIVVTGQDERLFQFKSFM